jgi:hypothetical protein
VAQFPNIVNYLEGTIMGSVKEKVMRAWTDRVKHLGIITTNKVEANHPLLKKYVRDN